MDIKMYCFGCMRVLDAVDAYCQRCGHDNHVRTNGIGCLPFSIVKTRYIIGKALGRGGFGVTYIGLDLSLERRVAIKEYMPGELVGRAHDQSLLTPYDEASRITFERGRERSMQEARTIACLNDVPDTVNVYDVFLANNTLYIVMEYIEGETLRAKVKASGGVLALETVLSLLKPIFAALSKIHRQGIIHRDVSPENIMFRKSNGRAVLLDFGAAHNLQLDSESDHSTSLRPGYAPVEQYSKNGLQDARTDEYALCATIYYAITGQKPVASMERAFGDATLPPPSALGIDISPAFEAVLMKGLSVLAKDRYDDVTALEAAFDSISCSVRELTSDSAPADPPNSTPTTAAKRHKALVWMLAVTCVTCVALATVSFSLWQRGNVPARVFNTNHPTDLEAGTVTPILSAMPALAETETASPMPVATNSTSPKPTGKPTVTLAQTATAVSTPTPTVAPTATSTPTPTPSVSPTAMSTPSPTPTATPTATPTQAPTKAPTATPNPISSATLAPAMSLYGIVGDEEEYEFQGQHIFRSREGWLYIVHDYGEIELWGIAGNHTLGNVETLTLPREINGNMVYGIAPGFSRRCEINTQAVKRLVSADTIWLVFSDSLDQFTSLETLVIEDGFLGPGFSFDDLPMSSPIYKNHYQSSLILNGTSLIYSAVDEKGVVKVPEGITYIHRNAFYLLDEHSDEYVIPRLTSITLPSTLKVLDTFSLNGFQGKELRIPDGVLLKNHIIHDIPRVEASPLKTIILGKNIRLDNSVTNNFVFFTIFKGTLYLEDGATMETLFNLFPASSKYTLSCQQGAVPESGIPKGVKVKYRK